MVRNYKELGIIKVLSTTSSRLMLIHLYYSNCRQIPCLKVRAKPRKVVTNIAEPRRVKVAQNSQISEASNAVLLLQSSAVRGGGHEVLPWP
jgi:hypothetical protein